MVNVYNSKHLKRNYYTVPLEEEKAILQKLMRRNDVEAKRLKRYLSMSDLTVINSPVKFAIETVLDSESFKNLDIITTPEIISPEIVFDLFNFPKDHPARKATDTYYTDEKNILRPHTSMMWKYYFDIPEIREKLDKFGSVGALSYGKCYRKDEIDWEHSNVFHQLDALFLCRKDIKKLEQSDLENICSEVTRSLLGNSLEENFNIDSFPYTDPSVEMNVLWRDKWVEVNGAGIVHPQVLKNLNIDPDIYNGWAFGFGVDRLAMLKMKIPDIRLLRSTDERVLKQFDNFNNIFEPVSKYPAVVRDISFIVDKNLFDLNPYYDVVRDTLGEEYVEEVEILDTYENEEKFGKEKISYTFRIVYRHLEQTLKNEDVNKIHEKLHNVTELKYNAKIRK